MCVWLSLCSTLCDPMDCSCQALLAMEFSRQEYWSGLPFPLPRDLPNLGIEPTSFVSPALAGTFFTTVPPGKPKMSLAKLVFFISSSLICSLVTLFSKMDRLE